MTQKTIQQTICSRASFVVTGTTIITIVLAIGIKERDGGSLISQHK
jgi:hypothetical protein